MHEGSLIAVSCLNKSEQQKRHWGLCASADGSKWKKTEKVDSSQSFYQLQGLTPGSHYRLLFTYSNTTFWETEIKTEGTGTESVLPSFILFSFIFSAPSSKLPTSKYKSLILQRMSCSFFFCLLWKKRLVIHMKGSITLFVCGILLSSLLPWWNGNPSEYPMLCLLLYLLY